MKWLTPAEQGPAAKALAELARQHMEAAKKAASGAEKARKAADQLRRRPVNTIQEGD